MLWLWNKKFICSERERVAEKSCFDCESLYAQNHTKVKVIEIINLIYLSSVSRR